MTVVNLALAADRALIVCDSLVSGADAPLYMSKAQVYPHLRLCVAVAGHHSIAVHMALWLSGGTGIGRDVDGIAGDAPGYLRQAWEAERLTSPTTVHLVGITAADELAAYALDSGAGFEPRRLPPGVWINPRFAPDPAATPQETAPEPRPAEPAVMPDPPPVAPWKWQEAAAAAVEAVKRQHLEQRVPVGGILTTTLITPHSIFTDWLEIA